ncbi:hypothetical protein ACIBHX_44070 [Nonomuraea sp. NPDC050536]|uniref:hypothetical protein n=1 Tax=Nonomuraea sp. NPDC050536 TaxID=3364366 RepID=UPI0037CA6B4B
MSFGRQGGSTCGTMIGRAPSFGLAVTNAFTALRLLPMGDRDKDVEILALRQISVLERQLCAFAAEDQAFLTALLTWL